jgi:hydrogenase maturation protein HypF
LDRFERAILCELLPRLPDHCQWRSLAEPSEAGPEPDRADFVIAESEPEGTLECDVPLDRVICDACRHEVLTAGNRRWGFALNSCAECGPRYTILRRMPYDRGRTSLAEFPLCPRCRDEYHDPRDRRFHAQGIGCAACGPRLRFAPAAPAPGVFDVPSRTDDWGAVGQAVGVIQRGGIVALKGVGGYQLACDATRVAAVLRLRDRKGRPHKPLAVMVRDLAEAESLVQLTSAERQTLRSPAGPIVLCEKRSRSALADNLAPGLRELGVMLPTSGLHVMLAVALARPLVITSGNREGEPIVCASEPAERQLGDIADGFLHHDRPVVRPIDDSVVRHCGRQLLTLRAGRGLAPLTISLRRRTRGQAAGTEECTVALGGHQKSAIALGRNDRAVLSPHIGDLDSLGNRERFEGTLRDLRNLYCTPPARLTAHDLHPDYFTTRFAEQHLSSRRLAVQHHYAHALAAIWEAGWEGREVLCLIADGSGYGSDGTLWGGEILRVGPSGWQRAGSLSPLPLPGGETAIREPWRIAVAMLQQAGCGLPTGLLQCWGVEEGRLASVQRLAASRLSTPTSSVGRLFDGVAAIVLGKAAAGYEGHLAALLESASDRREMGSYASGFEIARASIAWQPWLRQICAELASGVPVERIAMRFHRGLARSLVAASLHFQPLPVVFGGGVFQNRCLVELLEPQLDAHGIGYHFPSMIPPGDGGLAVGQLLAAERSRRGGAGRSIAAAVDFKHAGD